MVKIGFIVEGASEKKVLDSAAFRIFLEKEKIAFVGEVIDAKGGGQLLPRNRERHVLRLKGKGATHIIILSDKENDPCFTSVKKRIAPQHSETVLISAKALEAWFLADSKTLTRIFRRPFNYPSPENTIVNPFDIIKDEFSKRNKDFDTKTILADRMIRNGFTIQNAAAHKNCPSAKYFLEKLKSIAGIIN
ncbi:MAG: hypothetical protein ABIQ40_00090 [Bacteroidia bacterium]